MACVLDQRALRGARLARPLQGSRSCRTTPMSPLMSNHRRPYTPSWQSLSSQALWLAALLAPAAVGAQPVQPAPAQPTAAAEPAAAESEPPDADRPRSEVAPAIVPGVAGRGDEPVELSKDPLAEALRFRPGGLTPERVAQRAVQTSPALAAKRAQVEAAAAKLDQAFVAYFPIVTTAFTYTRLSEVENALDVGIDIPGMDTSGFSFPVILNSWSWTTQLAVPFSDYLLRLTQAYAAASETKQARRLEARAEALKVGADAKVAFLNWVRAKGARAVTEMAVESTSAHVDDARITLEAGLLSRADLLALESQLANAENLANRADAFEKVTAERVRLSMHAKPGTALTLGVDVLGEPLTVSQRPVDELQQRAIAQRLELRALAATKRLPRRAVSARRWLCQPQLREPQTADLPAGRKVGLDVGARRPRQLDHQRDILHLGC